MRTQRKGTEIGRLLGAVAACAGLLVGGAAITAPAYAAEAPASAVAATARTVPTPHSVQDQLDSIMAGHPGGTRTGKDAITWKSEGVTLKLASPAALADCGSGQFCLWQDNWSGRMLSWTPSARLCSGFVINLTDFGFNDVASSWADKTQNYTVDVWHDIGAGGSRLWTELPGTSSQFVTDNDEASSLNCHL
ncbi:peptidase inhibitor family I36 protein [Streptomyces graminilatus]|uniref:peptidase inhibitor family I36 protein n=1 Tax=Streptomyces graminilatus TaxID=1464070 RepID=UPI0006E2F2CA|nr:peptidase inhibitor family I36 protein [Streptomyces graminilatus]